LAAVDFYCRVVVLILATIGHLAQRQLNITVSIFRRFAVVFINFMTMLLLLWLVDATTGTHCLPTVLNWFDEFDSCLSRRVGICLTDTLKKAVRTSSRILLLLLSKLKKATVR
jgi:hypothetical protein